MTRKLYAIAAIAALAGCGKVQTLEPTATGSMPVKAQNAPQTATADELIAPSPQSRPGLNVEVLTRSRERQADEFELPPE